VLAAGVVLGGLAIGGGFAKARSADRFVTVKGVSEREVRADLALWPLTIVSADNDLSAAQQRIERGVREVLAFLARNGIDTASVTMQDYRVTDAFTNQYQSPGGISSRYAIRQTMIVRSESPDTVARASQRVSELVAGGVVFTSGQEYGTGGPSFLFTRLNDVKPEMIAEATAQAREAAEQFAHDSRSELGGIRRANQGVFQILPRNQATGITEESQVAKTVRVVATVDYFLK
jgi:hypothetical protein